MLNFLLFIKDFFPFIKDFFKFVLGVFCKLKNNAYCKVISTTALIAAIYSIYLIKYNNNIYQQSVNEDKVIAMMTDTLRRCGNYSYMTWQVIDVAQYMSYKNLKFRAVFGCDHIKSKVLNNNGDCIISIRYSNQEYLKEHIISKSTIDYIESDPILPNGIKIKSLTPVWFNLIDDDNKLTDDAQFLKIRLPEFWKIIKNTQLAVKQIGVILVRIDNNDHNSVIYIFTLSFAANADRKCNLENSGLQEGDYLYNVAKQSLITI